ncbi:hypothetical protein BH20GEM2_BH20GEM2_20880 [soil metagenome]
MSAVATAVEPARAFRALADPQRLRILELLRGGERCVCELTDAMDAGQSLLSFHLKTLKDAGLVSDRRQGRWAYYSVEPDVLEELEDLLAGIRTAGTEAVGQCCS